MDRSRRISPRFTAADHARLAAAAAAAGLTATRWLHRVATLHLDAVAGVPAPSLPPPPPATPPAAVPPLAAAPAGSLRRTAATRFSPDQHAAIAERAQLCGLTVAAYLQAGARTAPDPGRVAWADYRNLNGVQTPRDAALVVRAHAEELGTRVQKPVYHFGLSLAQGEHLSRDQWRQVVDRVLARMGLADHQAVVLAHRDTPHEHVHVMVNRVCEGRSAWQPFRDMVNARAAVRDVERDYGLRRTGPRSARRDLDPPALSRGAHAEALRTGRQPLAERVRDVAGAAFAQATDWRELEERLADRGLRLERAARGAGLLVTDGRRRASLSHIDRNLSGPRLARRFGETFQAHRLDHPEPPRVAPPSGRPAEPLPGTTLWERAGALVDRLGATRATFTADDLRRAAFHQVDSLALAREALNERHVLELGKAARGTVRYAARDYVEAEARLFAAAAGLRARADLRLEPDGVARTLQRLPQLAAEQRAAALHATTSDDLALVVGRAGAGKTTAARAIAAAYRDHGYRVQGAALAGKAAEALQAEAGIPSRTLASLEHGWKEDRGALDRRTVLLVDEAGMIDTRQLGRILDHAREHGAKVVLLGDPAQLKAIGAGDAYRGLLESHPSASLETVRRQRQPWQQAASHHLAAGRVRAALDLYDRSGRLHWNDTRAGAQADLVARYLADRASHPGATQVILAFRNVDAQDLNHAVRQARRAAGELVQPAVAIAGAEYTAGDRIVFLRNDHHGREVANLDRAASGLGVKNGTLGTVEHATGARLSVRLDDGRAVAFDPLQYTHVAHGYAVTIHKSQGATVDRAYALADPLIDRHAAYVAMTRHRLDVHLFADRDTFPDRLHLDRALARDSRKDLACDYAAAELAPAAARLGHWQNRHQALGRAHQTVRRDLDTVTAAYDASRELVRSRGDLERAAARVYADPEAALRALVADPRAADRLLAGEAHVYGRLQGRDRPLRGPDRARTAAATAVPQLRSHLVRHRQDQQTAASALQAAGRIGASLDHLRPSSAASRASSTTPAARPSRSSCAWPTPFASSAAPPSTPPCCSCPPKPRSPSESLSMRSTARSTSRSTWASAAEPSHAGAAPGHRAERQGEGLLAARATAGRGRGKCAVAGRRGGAGDGEAGERGGRACEAHEGRRPPARAATPLAGGVFPPGPGGCLPVPW
jgi:hypothetical protein